MKIIINNITDNKTDDKILERIFGNERENVKIARLRDEFEAQGMSKDWIDFIINSFIKQTDSQEEIQEETSENTTKKPKKQSSTTIDPNITYIEVTLTRCTS